MSFLISIIFHIFMRNILPKDVIQFELFFVHDDNIVTAVVENQEKIRLAFCPRKLHYNKTFNSGIHKSPHNKIPWKSLSEYTLISIKHI